MTDDSLLGARHVEWELTRQDVRQLVRTRLGRMWELPIIVVGLLVWAVIAWGPIGAGVVAVLTLAVAVIGVRKGFVRGLVASNPGSRRVARWNDDALTYVGVDGITTMYPWHTFHDARTRGDQLVLSRGYGSRPLIVVQIPLRALSVEQQREIAERVRVGRERRIAGAV